MCILISACQKSVTLSLLADRITLDFFGANSPNILTSTWAPMCCDYMFRPCFWNGTRARLELSNNAKHYFEFGHPVVFAVNCEQEWHLSCGLLSHTQVVIQNRNSGHMWYAYRFQDLEHFQSPIVQHLSWIFSIDSCVVTTIACPKHFALLLLVLPQRNSVRDFLPLKLMLQSSWSVYQVYPWYEHCIIPQKILLDEHTKSTLFHFAKIHVDVCFHICQTPTRWSSLLKN